MLAKRIIPCLDIRNQQVVKGTQFRNHKIIGNILPLIKRYIQEGADEIVLYDINASSSGYLVNEKLISNIAEIIDIPFCIAGGIRKITDASTILKFGADKISINSSALSNPEFISQLADRFGTQCVVVGIDSWFNKHTKKYHVKQYTGSEKTIKTTNWEVMNWIQEVQKLGAGEIVLNMMNHDGLCDGYDLLQLKEARKICKVPLIASGGAGKIQHFLEIFKIANIDGAIAASVFHEQRINIATLKKFLSNNGVTIRTC